MSLLTRRYQVTNVGVTNVANAKVGNLVLVDDYAVARSFWPLGSIVKGFPGHDTIVRSFKVKTEFGVMKRPVTKLPLLKECSPN